MLYNALGHVILLLRRNFDELRILFYRTDRFKLIDKRMPWINNATITRTHMNTNNKKYCSLISRTLHFSLENRCFGVLG